MSPFSDVASKEVLAGLRAALDPDPERAAKKYVLLRRKLVSLFEWNGSMAPDAAADATLTAMAWKMTDGGAAQTIVPACLAHARTLLSQSQEAAAPVTPPPAAPEPATLPPAASPLDETAAGKVDEPLPAVPQAPLVPAAAAPKQPEPQPLSDIELKNLLHAFETGLDALPEDSRDLVLTYYAGDQPNASEARHAVAKRLNLPMSQLRFHAHRTRSQLEQTVMGRPS